MNFFESFPLITVIIPCYNHGHYLGGAIDSVLGQSYSSIEVIVVDDGSSDHTREVAQGYDQRVSYVYKDNGGLSAARNTGIEQAKGDYIVFLDADDWLYPSALETNLHYLEQNPKAAFVSGGFDRVDVDENFTEEKIRVIKDNHYIELLKGNYIGVPAAVMYCKWVLDEINFNSKAPDSCGDYDLYLRITRKYPVLHHTQKVAAYRIHSSSMSANSPMMLASVLKVLRSQKDILQSNEEKDAYEMGLKVWRDYYSRELYLKLRKGKVIKNKEYLFMLMRNKPRYFLQFLVLGKVK